MLLLPVKMSREGAAQSVYEEFKMWLIAPSLYELSVQLLQVTGSPKGAPADALQFLPGVEIIPR